MSIEARIRDAQLLYANKHYDGALLSVLVALAATARKRYPRDQCYGDKEAFTRFFKEEFYRVSPLKVGGDTVLEVGDRRVTFQDFLYEYMRCSLVHEAELPADVRFEPPLDRFRITAGKPVIMSHGVLTYLIEIVVTAAENTGIFHRNGEEQGTV